MSRLKSKYRKRVTSDYLSNSTLHDDSTENLQLAQIVENRGGNLFLIKLFPKCSSELYASMHPFPADSTTEVHNNAPDFDFFVAKLPNKFNKCIWIKKNDFVMVSSFDEDIDSTRGASFVSSKHGYEINQILKAADVKAMKSAGVWPVLDSETAISTEKISPKPNSYMQEYEEMGKNDMEDQEEEGGEEDIAIVER